MKKLKEILAWIKSLFSANQRKNWKVVLLCVLAATTFWFFNALNKTYSTKINYPVEFEYNPLGLVNVEPLPEQVRLNVSGGGWNLLKKTIWFDHPPLSIPIEKPVETNYIIGSSLYPMVSEQLNDLQVNYVVTDTLYLHIEELKQRAIPVVIDSAGISLEDGYRIVSKINYSPDTLLFEGPKSMIEELPSPIALFIEDENIDEDFKRKIKLSTPYQNDLITASHDGVDVEFQTELFTRFSRVAEINYDNFPQDTIVHLADSIGILSFYVQQDHLDKLLNASFKLTADWQKINWADSTIRLEVTERSPFAVDLTVEPVFVKVESYEIPED